MNPGQGSVQGWWEPSHPGQATGSYPDPDWGEQCLGQGSGSIQGRGSSLGQGAQLRGFCRDRAQGKAAAGWDFVIVVLGCLNDI